MEKINTVSKLYLAGIVCSALIFSNQVLDPTLTPRVICFAFFSALSVLLLYRPKQKLNFEVDIINGSYLAFTLLCVLSISWSNTTTEAVFESTKTVLSFTVFSMTCFCLKHNYILFRNTLIKISIPITFIVLGFAFYQFTKNQSAG